jgi:uncharacterized protein (TIGR00288 family)
MTNHSSPATQLLRGPSRLGFVDEERIGLFLDFENLAIGAREQLGGNFEFKPIADALAERGRVVVRRAYADWSMFGDAMRDLTRHNVELIEIPQRMGMVRKNAADIKLAVDAIELSFERDYITTFVIGTGDSDFTPLVNKLRELNKRVLGIGIGAATSSLLPPACDEFLFYERLPGVDISGPKSSKRRSSRKRPEENGSKTTEVVAPADGEALGVLVTQTLSGLKRRAGDVVLASSLKRTLLRKDPTFDEANYGFRSFGELLANLAERKIVDVTMGSAPGDPEIDFPKQDADDGAAFELLRTVVGELGAPPLRGLKNELRKRDPEFSEKKYGYGGFLQFCKAAEARGFVRMEVDNEHDTFIVHPADAEATPAEEPVIAAPTDEAPPDEVMTPAPDEAPPPKKPTRRKAAARKPAKRAPKK